MMHKRKFIKVFLYFQFSNLLNQALTSQQGNLTIQQSQHRYVKLGWGGEEGVGVT